MQLKKCHEGKCKPIAGGFSACCACNCWLIFFQCLIVWKSNIPAKAIIGFDNSIACPVIYCRVGLLDSSIIARMGHTSTEIQGIHMFAAIVFNRDRDLKCWWGKLLLTSNSLAVLVWLKKFTGSYSSEYEIATEIIRSSGHFSFTSFFKKRWAALSFAYFISARLRHGTFSQPCLENEANMLLTLFCALKMVIETE